MIVRFRENAFPQKQAKLLTVSTKVVQSKGWLSNVRRISKTGWGESQQAGRGHWTVNYTGSQTFANMFNYDRLVKNFGDHYILIGWYKLTVL